MSSSAYPTHVAEETDVGPDDPIILGFLEGEPNAIRLLTRWAEGVARCHAWGFEAPEDMVQATLLALVQNLRQGRFRGGNLPAYVRRIAKNVCLGAYRKSRVRQGLVPLERSDPDSYAANPSPGPDLSSMLDRILQGLDPACRTLIVMAYLRGLRRSEIARQLGISETAAKVRLFRCLARARATQSRPCP
jgi:RNA polymerase sigma factor (sigma-70 family)